MKPKDEEFCREAFDGFLRKHLAKEEPRWDGVKQCDEPPDYYLDIGTDRFAVEVTSIVDYITVNGSEKSSVGIAAGLVEFCKERGQEALDEGVLHGCYELFLEPMNNLGARKQEIKKRVFDYMRRTAHVKKADPEVLAQDGHNIIQIEKWSDQPNCLEPSTSPGGVEWGSPKEEVRKLLVGVLRNKCEKLRKVSRPWILLLLDRYNLAEPADWLDAAQTLSFDGFHTVACVWDDQSTLFLHSQKKCWIDPQASYDEIPNSGDTIKFPRKHHHRGKKEHMSRRMYTISMQRVLIMLVVACLFV